MINIFDYATSELTQDAMIAWTLENIKSEKDTMKKVGLYFLNSLLKSKLNLNNFNKIASFNLSLQKYNIDILVKITLTNDDTIYLIIEDKTFSSEHNNQISKYKNKLKKDNPNAVIFTIYYKTGVEFNIKSKFEKRDVLVFNRKNILSSFKKLNEISKDMEENYLISSYYNYVKQIERQYSEYKQKEVNIWSVEDVIGFVNELHKNINRVYASWENNQSGGSVTLYSGLKEFEINALFIDNNFIKKKLDFYDLYKQVEFKFNSNKILSRIILQYRLSTGNNDKKIKSKIRYSFIEEMEKMDSLKYMKRMGRSGGKSCSLLGKEINLEEENKILKKHLKNEIIKFFKG